MRRRTVLKSSALFGLGALATGLVNGCSSPSTSSSSGAAPQTLRVGIVPWIGFEGLYLAEQKGLFAAEGIQVEQKVFQTVTEVNTALLAKQIDMAGIVAVDLVILTAQVPDIKTILITDYSGDVDAILSSKSITKPEDLRGKKLAREDIPYEIVFVSEYLKQGGLTEKDVEIVPLTAADGAAAFVAGKVDAVATYEPFVGKALKERQDSKLLFSAKNTNIIPNAVVAHGQVISDQRDAVLAYIRAVEQGLQYSAANRAEADELLAKWLGVTTADITDQRSKIKMLNLADNKSIAFNPGSSLSVDRSLKSAAQILLDNGKVKQPVDPAKLIDGSLVQAL